MSKYDELREQPENEGVVGSRQINKYIQASWQDGEVTMIHGFPACPMCRDTLEPAAKGDWWTCNNCKTTWDNYDLIQAIRAEKAFMSKEEV